MSKLQLQPIETDGNGYKRFRENKVVRYLLDNGGLDLNHLAVQYFPNEDREQFAQLIGYSVSGFGELGYVGNETYETANAIAQDSEMSAEDARLQYLEECLSVTRESLKILVPKLFKIHPDDLEF